MDIDEPGIFVFYNSKKVFPREVLLFPQKMNERYELGVSEDLVCEAFGNLDCYLLTFCDSPSLKGTLLDDEADVPSSWKEVLVRDYIKLMGEEWGNSPFNGRLFRLFHILQWRKESAYCGSCGHKNTDHQEELARLCPSCGRMEYPRISPGICVLIKNEVDQILLAHNRNFKKGVFSPPSGFVEAGENIEAALRREVREELGIEVGPLEYIVSQIWPFPNSLVMAFKTFYTGGILKEDGNEIDEARWFSRCDITDSIMPRFGSIGYYCIEAWLTGKL